MSYTVDDPFCLDGQKLVVASGVYGADGNYHYTERDTFVRVMSVGAAGSGPASFKVWTKADLVMEYGTTDDARILAQGRAEVRVWALNKVSDTKGNYFTIGYTQDPVNDEYFPARIDYTGNTTASVLPFNRVEFTYETRPDPSYAYAAGSLVGQAQRLSHILAYAGDTLVSDCALNYDLAPVTRRSRLASLTRCAGNGDCLAPTVFAWSDGELANYAPDTESPTPAGSVNDLLFALGDITADGRTDALVFDTRNNTFSPLLAQVDGSLASGAQSVASMATDWGTFLPDKRLWLADIDGTGTADAVLFGRTILGAYHYFGATAWSANAEGTIAANPSNEAEISPFSHAASGGNPFAGAARLSAANASAYYSAGNQHWFSVTESNSDGKADMTAYLSVLAGYGGTNAIVRNYPLYGAAVSDTTSPVQSYFLSGDVNGDALADALRYDPATGLLRVWLSNGAGLNATPVSKTIAKSGSPAGQWFLLADVNGDGLGDLVLYTPANGLLRTWLSKGDGTFAAALSFFVTGGSPADTWFQIADVNSDGRADAVKYDPVGGILTYAVSLGDGGFDAPATLSLGAGPLPTPNIGPSPTTPWFSPADMNGDGVLDWVRFDPAWARIKVKLAQGGMPDQLLSVTDGFGADTRFAYKQLTDASVYTKGTGAAYPTQDVQAPIYVVAETATDDGTGGSFRKTYRYAGLIAKLDGEGLLGFKSVSVRDEQSGIVTATEYRQDSPYTGQVASLTETTAGGVLVRKVDYIYNVKSTAYNAFVYQSDIIESTYELNGAPIKRVETNQYMDAYGNLTSQDVFPYTGASDVEDRFERRLNTYTNDTANWILGRLTQSKVFPNIPLGFVPRISAFEYDPASGLLTREIIEPGQPQLRLNTTYAHDAFGNRRIVTVDSPATGAAAIAPRSTTTAYDTKGQFAISTTNALAHTETKTFDARFGTVATLTGPNNLTTTWQYDGFGRKTQELRADGTQTVWTYAACDAACPTSGVYRIFTQVYGVGGIQAAPTSAAYFDRLNRTVRLASQGFDGRWIYTDTQYDGQGRVAQVSRPYYAGGVIYWARSEYDELGRIVKTFEPDVLAKPALTVAYNGLTVTRTNRKGQATSETRNSQGQKISVTDALTNLTQYTYDPFGNLTHTTDPAGNQIVNLYDLRGRKTQTTDPDLGVWKYEYDALGELVKQTDAQTQVSTMSYDLLGRMTSRVEPGLTSTWIWDTAAYGKGKLQRAKTSAGYFRAYLYDNLGRIFFVNTNTGDGNALGVTTAYDSSGRIASTEYPSTLTVKNIYNAWGYLTEVRSAETGALYWQQTSVDAEGHSLQENLRQRRRHPARIPARQRPPARYLCQHRRRWAGAAGAVSVRHDRQRPAAQRRLQPGL